MNSLTRLKISFFFLYAFLAASFNFLGLYYNERFHFSVSQIGLLQSLLKIVSIGSIPLLLHWGKYVSLSKIIFMATMLGSSLWSMHLLLDHLNFTTTIFLVVSASLTLQALPSLVDSVATTLLSLDGQNHRYGEARLFGSVGWGLSSYMTGFIISYLNDPSSSIMIGSIFSFLFIVTVPSSPSPAQSTISKSKEMKGKSSSSSSKTEFTFSALSFFISAACMGCAFGSTSSFQFLYLKQTWNAPSSLMGLTIIAQVLLELPFFHCSSSLIAKYGTVTVAFISHGFLAIRFLCYLIFPNLVATESTLSSPLILFTELFHGPAFALYYSSGILLATQQSKQPQSESLLAGIFGSVFSNLGGFGGSLVGGYLLNKFGYPVLWSGSLLMTGFSVLFLALSIKFKAVEKKKID